MLAGVSGGAHPLWLTEWLCESLDLAPGMRVLDLGCGRALSSVFLHREFGVQVWAADYWFSATENLQRIRDAGVEGDVFPVRCEARSLPFAEAFFDVVVGVDSFPFFGTDDLYLNYVARYLKPSGVLAIAQAGFVSELHDAVPAHMAEWWAAEGPYCLHSADWWRSHWERSRIVDVALADTLPEGSRYWLEWLKCVAPENEPEIRAVETDGGRNFTYVRVVARRRGEAQLFDPHMTAPAAYAKAPLLRS